ERTRLPLAAQITDVAIRVDIGTPDLAPLRIEHRARRTEMIRNDAKLLAVHELGEGSEAFGLEEPGDGRFGASRSSGLLVASFVARRSVRGAPGEERFQRFFISGE